MPDGLRPTKVVAVHLNYRSRAEQRGRTPSEPSYFLKPPSSVSDGGPVVRPQGAELLAYEGEIAVIVGATVREATLAEAGAAIGWYAAANDFGAHDFRWADRGSNLLSKGHDGYTPLGAPVPADTIDAATLRLRTRVNGEVVQEAGADELLFGFAELIADLSRFMTLERGDVILTGTPAGTGVVEPGDVVEVELDGLGSSVRSTVVAAEGPLAEHGAMPRATPAARAFAIGMNAPRPVTLSGDAVAALREVSTATLTVQLAKHGVANTFLTGLRPARPDLRMVGYAHTLRYVALREDVRDARKGTEDAQKLAVETVSPDDVLIMEARGEAGAGTIGDILAARVLARGGAGIVTDGGVRDSPGVSQLGIPTYFQIPNAASLWLRHIPIEVDGPITCAGTLVMPGDVIVGDAEGVVVLPAALAERIAHDAVEQEEREAWALERVQAGESIRGVYPITDQRRAEYERWRATRNQEQSR
ncbi:MAG TPA: fumarylacetoacetate hydrolase family protein [Baekduia sp.]|nr:fumarylacetoacetate hydrolase family protein [Baekduia sp.]